MKIRPISEKYLSQSENIIENDENVQLCINNTVTSMNEISYYSTSYANWNFKKCWLTTLCNSLPLGLVLLLSRDTYFSVYS